MAPAVAIPKYIPLSEAASQLNIGFNKLHDMASVGRIPAIRLPNGGLAVQANIVEKPLRKEDLDEYKQFDHLDGETTWVSKAERDYGIPNQTISRWASDGIINIEGKKGRKTLLNAQDVAYCAFVYQKFQDKGTQGRRLFDDMGLPYKPKTGPFAV